VICDKDQILSATAEFMLIGKMFSPTKLGYYIFHFGIN